LKRSATEETLRCSFCHRTQDSVRILIPSSAGYPRAYICDECISICHSVVEQKIAAEPESNRRLPQPVEVKAFLDEYVIGQDKTKKKLAVAVYNHYAPRGPERRGIDEVQYSAHRPHGNG